MTDVTGKVALVTQHDGTPLASCCWWAAALRC
jgi:hypothetical protein